MQTVSRLVKQFIPKNYKLSILLDRQNRVFSGSVIISGNSLDEKSIILHAKDLDIKSILVNSEPTSFSVQENNEMVISKPNKTTGNTEISIEFAGKISDGMHGIYPCYFDHDGIKKELLATQFESHHAREVFPCIDEPAAKATYDVTLMTEKNIVVLGNTPIVEQHENNDYLVTTFETTPIMSSYLLAFVVGELHKKTTYTKNGVEVNAWATIAQPDYCLDFALDIAKRSIEFYDDYFDTPYPLAKCDNVALPDFSSGAMENWGLINYREVAMLADPKTTSISNRQYIATVIAHEISHQWFGNLVTMEWWNDLWLNESFASLVEYSAVDALEPNWKVWLDFASYDSVFALKRDSLAGVQSVQTDVNHPDEIMSLFDGAIVYAKGARLLQMLQKFIGEDAFRSGLKEYFKTHAYKNTIANDLWKSLSDASGMNVGDFMHKWISQPGYPVLHVERRNNQISLRQDRMASPNAPSSDSLWPITLNSNYAEMPKIFDTKSVNVDIQDKNTPLRFNIGSYAHFVTHYQPELLAQIINELKSGSLQAIDRLQLLNEQVLLANNSVISNAELIPLLASYETEDTESVWDIIGSAIGELKKFVSGDDVAESNLRKLASKLAKNQYDRLGWDKIPEEVESDTKLRSMIISLMLYAEDSGAVSKAIDLFKSTKLELLDPELRGQIISTAVKFENDFEVMKSLINTYESTSSAGLEQDICFGLTSVRDIEMIKYLLDLVKDATIIRNQDSSRWIVYLLRNKYSRELAWEWMRENWDWIEKSFKGDKSYDDFPRYAATALLTKRQLDEYREFFLPKLSDPALTRVIEMGINELSDRVSLIERDRLAVKQALLNNL